MTRSSLEQSTQRTRLRSGPAMVALRCGAALLGVVVAAVVATAAEDRETAREVRFDHLVRNDFFAGFTGDRAAFDRGMKTTEEVLAKNPKHAEAMVWHGAGLLMLAGQEFQKGNRDQGIEKWQRALKEMDDAVKLEPKNIGVRIPRAASLTQASRFVPDPKVKEELLLKVVDDYETTYEMQKSDLGKLGVHPRGELLFGLAEGWRRLGKEEKARGYLEQIVATCKESPYEKEAKEWLEKDVAAGGKSEHTCVGCHVGNDKVTR